MDNKWNEAGMLSFITISLVLFSAETANCGGLRSVCDLPLFQNGIQVVLLCLKDDFRL